MRIGTPFEYDDTMILLTPESVSVLRKAGHEVILGSAVCFIAGFTKGSFIESGAAISDTVPVYRRADIVVKASKSELPEYYYFRKRQVMVGFLNLSSNLRLVKELMRRGVRAIDVAAIQTSDGAFPILDAAFQIAGRIAVHIGANLLQKAQWGRGVLLGGASGVPPANVVVVGGRPAGTEAAVFASSLGANVILLEHDGDKLNEIKNQCGERVDVREWSPLTAESSVEGADLVIGAIHPGDREPPVLVTEDMVKKMKRYSVIVDVAPEYGSCIETMDRAVTEPPAFLKYGVLHSSVPHLYRKAPRISSVVLSKAMLPYILELAGKGFERAVRENQALAQGVCVADGRVTNKRLAEIHGLRYTPLERVVNLFN